MQAATLPLSAGWLWIQDGYKLFLRQPAAMFFWSLMTGVLFSASYLLPIVGQMVLIAATPMLAFITLSACRNIAQGRRMAWGMWLEPIRKDPQARRRLMQLGAVYLAFCLVAGFLATLPFLDNLTAAISAEGEIDETALFVAMRGPFITFGLLYVLISALFWHAPALIGWHHIPMGQAMFYSMVACWRNKFPFLAYGASWAAIFFAFQMAGTLLISVGLTPAAAQMLLTPVNLAVAAVLYCSFYPAYVSVFGANYPIDAKPHDPAPPLN